MKRSNSSLLIRTFSLLQEPERTKLCSILYGLTLQMMTIITSVGRIGMPRRHPSWSVISVSTTHKATLLTTITTTNDTILPIKRHLMWRISTRIIRWMSMRNTINIISVSDHRTSLWVGTSSWISVQHLLHYAKVGPKQWPGTSSESHWRSSKSVWVTSATSPVYVSCVCSWRTLRSLLYCVLVRSTS